MIKGTCRTNLDEYQFVIWPRIFARCPNIGEWVSAEGGKSLRICGITHSEKDGQPFVIVDLDKLRL